MVNLGRIECFGGGGSAASPDELKSLIALCDSINASMDAYVSLTPEEKVKEPRVDRARQQIWKAATRLADETVVPQ